MPPKRAATAAASEPTRASKRSKTAPVDAATTSKAKVLKPTPANTKVKRDAKNDAEAKTATTKATGKTAAKKAEPASEAAPAKAAAKSKAKDAAAKAPAETAAKKSQPKVEPKAAAPTTSRKRKAEEDDKPAAPKKARKALPVINEALTQPLDVFVFGGGESGELGLGPNVKEVKRPRLNPFLPSDTVQIVDVAVGGMHTLALSKDNKIWSWGVNDQGALGRNTDWDGGLRDVEADAEDSDSEDGGLNPHESTPAAIPSDVFGEDVKIASIAAGDSCSFAVTTEGLVYGWGTFRSNEGILGFTKDIFVQRTPMLLPELKNIKSITCGTNHAIALDKNGSIFAWGAGEQHQLGRRLTKNHLINGLRPTELGGKLRRKVRAIGAGSMHSFAITKDDKVFAWGLNQYDQFGCSNPEVSNAADIPIIMSVDTLSGRNISVIRGGQHHSLAVDGQGNCLIWGRCDGSQTGLDLNTIPKDDLELDVVDKPAKLTKPTAIPGIDCSFASTGSDHSLAITKDGKAYSWGFGANFQTGQGTDEDVETATLIDNTATRDKKLNWAGAGGQFSVLTAIA